MGKDVPIVVFDESEGAINTPDNRHMDLIELKLNIFGKLLHIYIGAEDKLAKLSDIVPLARFLSTKIISTIKQHVNNNGDTIACHSNCSHCCRYLVPLTIPEAMCLTEEVRARPQWERRFVEESYLLTARCILGLTPKCSLKKFAHIHLETGSRLKDLSDWYGQINLPCPFLLNNLCTIYKQRPIACREHLVISSPSDCKGHSTNHPQLVQMPISILNALACLTSELEQATNKAIILPFALIWCLDNPEYFKHTWPASYLVRRFINILTTQNRYDEVKEYNEIRSSR